MNIFKIPLNLGLWLPGPKFLGILKIFIEYLVIITRICKKYCNIVRV